MATITDQYVVRQCGERWRPRAEQALGLVLTARYINTVIASISCPDTDDVIDDGILGQHPFTCKHFNSLKGLVALIAATPDASIAALRGLAIRSDNLLMLPLGVDCAITTPALALRYLLRPFAQRARAIRRMVDDDKRINPLLIDGLADADMIDEEQPDGRTALVEHVRVMHESLSAMTGESVNTSAVADATDAACVSPFKGE